MIIRVSNKKYSKYKVVLTFPEVKKIVPFIKWVTDDMYSFNTKNDNLSNTEVKKLKMMNPDFDFFTSNNYFEIDNAICRNFSLIDYIENKNFLPQKGTSPVLGLQISPINNCPTFSFRNEKYIWHHDFGLFEVLSNNKSIGFYNSYNMCLVFKHRNQFDKYIEEINLLNSILQKLMKNENNDRYVRVISVYNKKTKELKYRILNEEFNYNSFAFINLKPFENDLFFLKSYKITETIAKEYSEWSYLDIDYNFIDNEYFFETLNSKIFTYSQKDIFGEENGIIEL